jgi:hypothetical protein
VEPPTGLPAGPWVLAPSLVAGYGRNSNVFLQSAEATPGPVSDTVLRVTPGLVATLPFRNSALKFSFSATRLDYGKIKLTRNLSREGSADLALVFATTDRLSLRAKRTLGIAETIAFDPGGEYRFQGQGFDLDTYEVEAARDVLGHPGYKARIAWSALSLERGASLNFFEYRGYEAEGSFREPVSPRTWIVGDYEGRRYDHYLLPAAGGSPIPYRQERTDMLRAGVEGRLGEHEPFLVLVGWGRFRFPGSKGSNFDGLVVEANAAAGLGPSTTVFLDVTRRPWPSFFYDNNVYLVEGATARIEHRWLERLSAGAELGWHRASYMDPVPEPNEQAGLLRRDRTLRAALYANLMMLEKLGFRVSIEENHRSSNAVEQDYRGRVYFVGIALGWI